MNVCCTVVLRVYDAAVEKKILSTAVSLSTAMIPSLFVKLKMNQANMEVDCTRIEAVGEVGDSSREHEKLSSLSPPPPSSLRLL